LGEDRFGSRTLGGQRQRTTEKSGTGVRYGACIEVGGCTPAVSARFLSVNHRWVIETRWIQERGIGSAVPPRAADRQPLGFGAGCCNQGFRFSGNGIEILCMGGFRPEVVQEYGTRFAWCGGMRRATLTKEC
jgi:hypothetical protein